MPSNKRARQKAARQARLRAEAARRRRKRIITQAVVFLALVAVVIVILALLNNGGTKTVSKKTTSSALFNSSGCPPQWSSPAIVKSFTSPPPFLINKNGTYYANFYTDVGTIKVLLDPKLSPVNVNNFIFLACHHFYDNTVFHRVIPGFVDQGGSPNPNNPNGGPGYSVIDEYPKGAKTSTPYQVGQLAMANTGAGNSAGSQFFFVVGPNGPSILDQDVAHGAEPYTIIGNVVSGMSVVEKINQDGSSNGTPKVLHKLLKVIITK